MSNVQGNDWKLVERITNWIVGLPYLMVRQCLCEGWKGISEILSLTSRLSIASGLDRAKNGEGLTWLKRFKSVKL